jgi:phage gp36-like protein
MPYVTQAQLEQRFGETEVAQLLDRDRNGSADASALTAAQTGADALIDGYLRAANAQDLPLSTVPSMVTDIAADIVRFKLWDKRAPEEVRKRYEDAIKRLQDIGRGLIKLDLDTPAAPLGSPSYTTRTRTFDDDTMCSFMGGAINDDY